jgi:hypothetical protein
MDQPPDKGGAVAHVGAQHLKENKERWSKKMVCQMKFAFSTTPKLQNCNL